MEQRFCQSCGMPLVELFLAAFAMAQERNYISICGKTKTSIKWTEEHKSSNTNLSISLNNGIYSISGKFNGKQISKKVKSKGKPWYQNIAYNAGLTLKNGRSVEYECFRPDNIKLYTMSAVKKGNEKLDGKNAVRIEVSLAGFMSAFWSCDYYFDTSSLMFVGYKGVNGGPRTPETKISVAR